MKFYQLLYEAVKKYEIQEILNDPNFRIGIEFEFIFNIHKLSPNEIKDINNNVDFSNIEQTFSRMQAVLYSKERIKKIEQMKAKYQYFLNKKISYLFGNSNEWQVISDLSVHPNDMFEAENEIGVEVVTPILTIEQTFKIIPQFFKLIDYCGYTNDSCGLHVNISHSDIDINNLNSKALARSLEDPRIYKSMPSREKNKFAQSTEKYFLDTGDVKIEKKQTMNIQKDRVEFRAIGGTDYHKKWDEIKSIILNYLVKFKKAGTDPNFMSKKLNVNNHDDFTIYQDAIDLIKNHDLYSFMQIYPQVKDQFYILLGHAINEVSTNILSAYDIIRFLLSKNRDKEISNNMMNTIRRKNDDKLNKIFKDYLYNVS